jgi:hypothetical protein
MGGKTRTEKLSSMFIVFCSYNLFGIALLRIYLRRNIPIRKKWKYVPLSKGVKYIEPL